MYDTLRVCLLLDTVMKSPVYALILLAMALGMGACSLGKDNAAASVEKNYDSLGPVVSAYMAAREADSVAGWGLVRCDGSMLFSNKFPEAPSAAVNGYFTVRTPAGFSVYKAQAEPVVVDGLDGLVHAGAMSHGLMPVTWRGKRVALVDGSGVQRMELTAISGREIVKTAPYFIDGLLTVYTQDGKWGAMNTSGEMVLEPVYDNEPHFSERIAPVSRTVSEQIDSVTERKRTTYYLVNSSGKTIFTFPEGMKPRSSVHGGAIVVELPSGKSAMMGIDGTLRSLPAGTKSVGEFDKDYIVWSNAEGRMGLADHRGNILMEPRFRSIHIADSDRIISETMDRIYCISDSAGNPKVRLNGFDKVKFMKYSAPGTVSPFSFVGEGYAGTVLMDGHGHRIGAGPFKGLSVRPTLLDDGYVHTDFFNTQAAVHSLMAKLTAGGWGDVALHSRMGPLSDSIGEKQTRIRSLRFHTDSLYMLTLEAIAYSDRPVATDSLTDEGTHIYRTDSLSRVKYIRVEASVPGRKFPDMVQHAGAELVPMGFRAEKIRDEYAVYGAERMMVIIAQRPGLEGLFLFVMDHDFYKEAGERIIADAEKTFLQSTKPNTPR